MKTRIPKALLLAGAVLGASALASIGAQAQSSPGPAPTLASLTADLKAPAPYSRSAAAFGLAQMGPAAAPAVPALIDALQDPNPGVRYRVAVALREIGPAAKPAVPALKKAMKDDINDEVADAARRAVKTIDPAALDKDE